MFPSTVFFAKGSFRIIICTSVAVIAEFADRLEEFCKAYYIDRESDKQQYE